MNLSFLLAGVVSAVTCCIHFFAGGRFVAAPLLFADGLRPIPKYTAYYCWHLVTIMLAGTAFVFIWCGLGIGSRDLAAAAILFTGAAMVWSGMLIVRYRLNPIKFPQWALFAPSFLLGAAGWWG